MLGKLSFAFLVIKLLLKELNAIRNSMLAYDINVWSDEFARVSMQIICINDDKVKSNFLKKV
jgi:hypothetical protein